MSFANKPSRYLWGWHFDFLSAGGLSLLFAGFVAFAFRNRGFYYVPTSFLTGVAFLTWIVNYPHFAASLVRLYGSSERRTQHPFAAFLLPVFTALFTIVAMAGPASFASTFVKVFLYWSCYHYAGQAAGIAFFYAAKACFEIRIWERRAIWALVYSASAYQILFLESVGNETWLAGIPLSLSHPPPWVSWAAGSLCLASALWVSLLFFARKDRPSFPWMLSVPLISHVVWFVVASRLFAFQAFVPLFHGVQYLFLAGSVENRNLRTLALWASVSVGGGAFLFAGLPAFAMSFGVLPNSSVTILFAAVQMHHFALDGVLWRLRSPSVEAELHLLPQSHGPAARQAARQAA